ncbi:D-arabinose 1-dehydrogenase, Zn-dependent alcohol dehydrogenase family [Micromonospora rhizosphaerae]|uniref:D-arabinose 1-dehydrogenase, Zn-dependent alcohol dehydrogenase family n=1 Tax=Micromonospora rhizosphaerae TaxID=568872 RepID=A0A1C6SEL1_9ACTN|nr:zinc-binding dehydrogenase [Micromonospora rhizosphaerae]SCL27788.1 D-arabinose 1-dehydrogenase, Zn-dependent alcohol dehydrogenase family [Micromonospora rhizosphaerae]
MAEMLAARLHVTERALRLERVPIPEPDRGQVRIRVAAAGICLSDVHLIDGALTPLYLPGDVVTLGHEVAGVIDALGDGVEDWQPGQRVLLQAGERDRRGTLLTRGVDYDGGWAEYALAREDTVVLIPDAMPFEHACIIPDAVSTPWAAVIDTARTRPAEAVGVWGVGGLGAHAVQLLLLVGAAPVIAVDPLPAARDRALTLGADVALDPRDDDFRDALLEATNARGLDVAFDFAGVRSAREQALTALGRHGRLVLTGIANQPVTIPSDSRFNYSRQTVLGHYGSEAEHVDQLVALANQGRLDLTASISDVLPLTDAAEAVRRVHDKEGNPIRIILRP